MNLQSLLCFLGLAMIVASTKTFAQVPATTAPTTNALPSPLRIILIGDSTVCDYPPTHANRGWGSSFRSDSITLQ